MRYKIISVFLLLFAFLLIAISNTSAQDVEGTSSAVRVSTKNILKTEKENFLETIQRKRETASHSAVLKRNQFKKNIKLFRDQAKAEIAQRIDGKILSVNLERTNKLADALDKLQSVLDRIEQKGQDAKAQGKDTSVLDAAIVNAKTAIASAQALVLSQAGKQYVINATGEATLKSEVGSIVRSFRTDLAGVHKSVVDAKHSVKKAASELARIVNLSGINPENKSSATEEAK